MHRAGTRVIAWSSLLAGLVLLMVLGARSMAADLLSEPDIPGGEASLRLLSQSQYANTIEAIFGKHIVPNVRFAPVPRAGGLTAVGARAAVMTVGALEPMESAARAVAGAVVSEANRDLLIPCWPAAGQSRDDACAREFLAPVGQLLFRRTLFAAELGRCGASGGRRRHGCRRFLHGSLGGAFLPAGLPQLPLHRGDRRTGPREPRALAAGRPRQGFAPELLPLGCGAGPRLARCGGARAPAHAGRAAPRTAAHAGLATHRAGRTRVLQRHASRRRIRPPSQGSGHLSRLHLQGGDAGARATAAHHRRPPC